MKKTYLYAIIVIVIIAIVIVGFVYFSPIGKMMCGPCGCFGDQCGVPSPIRYYWNCTTGLKCSAYNPRSGNITCYNTYKSC